MGTLCQTGQGKSANVSRELVTHFAMDNNLVIKLCLPHPLNDDALNSFKVVLVRCRDNVHLGNRVHIRCQGAGAIDKALEHICDLTMIGMDGWR